MIHALTSSFHLDEIDVVGRDMYLRRNLNNASQRGHQMYDLP